MKNLFQATSVIVPVGIPLLWVVLLTRYIEKKEIIPRYFPWIEKNLVKKLVYIAFHTPVFLLILPFHWVYIIITCSKIRLKGEIPIDPG